ncbi:Centrosome-associated zinc finger protein CP190 [Sergentomyia squamirostris]
MTEIKSVKVDNWGVFFLQKLQNFFNKTDYCDLTLQFRDNSQLKVHRLVLSACTDYFNLLETTCEMHGDILIMPRDLQADVVVPIVNFMYTGTLEFEVVMYERLLKTARDMNMSVLLKLLEAHRRSIPSRSAPVILNKSAQQQRAMHARGAGARPAAEKVYATPSSRTTITQIGGVTIKREPGLTYVRKTLMVDPVPEPVALVSKYPHVGSKTGPSRFEPPDENITEAFDSSFNTISYESKPLITADQLCRDEDEGEVFEKLRKSGYTNPKRPAAVNASPPHKKLNLQDVKEYTEAAKMRKQIEAEGADSEPRDYDDIDDTYSNSSDDQTHKISATSKGRKATYSTRSSGGSEDNRPTVVVQESGKVNHAKIISEVLKKYPHLVKNNKNIKLKILQKSPQATTAKTSESEQHGEVKPKPTFRSTTTPPSSSKFPVDPKNLARGGRIDSKTMHMLIAKGAENMDGPWLCLRCGVDGRPIGIPTYKGFRRHLINVHNEKIDPRICEHCGWKAKSTKKSELYYHILVKHQIKPPGDTNFPKCKDCSFIAPDESTLSKHLIDVHAKRRLQHQTCIYCNKSFPTETALFKHMHTTHKARARQDGILDDSDPEEDPQQMEQYEDEADKYVPNVEGTDLNEGGEKIKILSNISLSSAKTIPFVLDPSAQHVSQIQGKASTKLEPSSEAEALSNVASGIATSLGLVEGSVVIGEGQFQGDTDLISSQYIEAAMADVHGEYIEKKEDQEIMTKLVTEDGSELELTPEQKEELMSQLQGQNDNVVMVLNQDNFVEGSTQIINSADQKIVVVYSQADDGLKETYLHTSDIKDTVLTPNTPMEWQESTSQDSQEDNSQENTLSQDDDDKKPSETSEDTATDANKTEKNESKNGKGNKKSKSDEDKLKLISELEGDWSEEDEVGMESESGKEELKKEEDMAILRTSIIESNQSAEDDDEVGVKETSGITDVEQNLSALLEDWNNDSQTSTKESVEDAKEKSPEKEENKADIGQGGGGDQEQEQPDDCKDGKSSKSDNGGDNSKKSSEIKTLINDWGDDDEDL